MTAGPPSRTVGGSGFFTEEWRMRRWLFVGGVAGLGSLFAACAAGPGADPGGDGAGGGDGEGTTTSTGAGGSGGSGGGEATITQDGGVACGKGKDLEGCRCAPGTVNPCYAGDEKLAGVGACKLGTQTCGKPEGELNQGTYGACEGSVAPVAEICGNGVDDDCDGVVDQGCDCGAPSVTVTGLDGPLACGSKTAKAVLTFSKPVTGVVAGDTVTVSGGAVIDSIAGGPAVYEVSLSGLDVGGPYTLDIEPKGAKGTIENACHAPLDKADKVDFAVAQAIAPKVTIDVPSPVPCGAQTTKATLTFDQPVTGVVANDTVLATGGAQVVSVSGGPAIYEVDLAGLAGGGSYSLSVLPSGLASNIVSQGCNVPLAAQALAPFGESNQGASELSIAPWPSYAFPPTPIGQKAQATFTASPVGNGGVANVTAKLAAPFAFVGGAYPGVGGTCGANIAAPCTVVVEFTPGQVCGFWGQLELDYDSCGGQKELTLGLSGPVVPGPTPTTCASSNTLYVSPAGSDANAGTNPAAPKKTIGAALAISQDGTEIHAAAGTYAETVSVSGCRKLFGGYDASFQSRDPKKNVSTITANVSNGGVVSFPGALLHLDGFTVQNTAADGYGLYYFQGGSVISNNVIQGGSHGMYFWQHMCGAIHDNVVSGSTAGLYFWQSAIPVYGNQVKGDSNGVTTWQNQGLYFAGNSLQGGSAGLQTWQEQGMIFDGNRIVGTSQGVSGWQSTGVTYKNNLIYGPQTGLDESSNGVVLANNTIGSGGTGVNLGASDYVVVNNLFFSTAGGGTAISGTMPSSVENNVFVGFASVASFAQNVGALNALDGKDLGIPNGCTPNVDCWTARVAANTASALQPSAIFTSPGGMDGVVATLGDDDWHLLTKDAQLTAGGKDASQLTCGSKQAPRNCGAVTMDADGAPRSVPYSVGAYEKN
jgi:hypothetical protein